MKKNKKGFTLIELLAVIVILAIIALIATPAIINVIENARKKAFENTAYGVLDGLRLEYMERVANGNTKETKFFTFPDSGLKLSGEQPAGGTASTDIKGNITFTLFDKDKKWCAKKDGASEKVTILDYNENDCKTISLKEEIEKDESHIAKNVKVNGETVNKVIGAKSEKLTMKNYVWYMGQLWQVLETNDTNNTIKLITAQSITSIAYGETSDYNTSWVKKWLNEVFYNSLEGTDLVRNTNFCLDKVVTNSENIIDTDNRNVIKVNSHTPISACQNKITEKVGLMSFEDYVYSNNGTNAVYDGGSYLDEDELEWTLTAYDNSHNWIQWYNTSSKSYITSNNNDLSTVKGYGHGVRPVISIDGSSVVKEGEGTKKNPYVLLNERKVNSGSKINNVKVGDYVYLDESNNPNNFTEEYVARDLKYATTKDKVRYRVVKKNADGTVKVERADVLRNLPNTVAIGSGIYVPYYYKASTDGCYYNSSEEKWYTIGCSSNNIFKAEGNTNEYNYQNSINIGNFLNSSSNSFYNWYSDITKNMINEKEYDRFTGGYAKDYSNLNNNETGTYPSTTNDGKVTAKVALPTWGEMYSGNDLNVSYWYINRWTGSSSDVSHLYSSGDGYGYSAGDHWVGARPVVTLKSNVKISGGEGTMTKPYSLSL